MARKPVRAAIAAVGHVFGVVVVECGMAATGEPS